MYSIILMNRIKNEALHTFTNLFLSFLLAYSCYVYLLQPESFFSKSRLAAAIFVWIIVFSLLCLWRPQLRFDQFFAKGFSTGILGIFLLLNLILAAILTHIPYTYTLLPTQNIRILPLTSNQTVDIQSFITDIGGWTGINHFETAEGWHGDEGRITLTKGGKQELVWVGKPGQFVKIIFSTCAECGKVGIEFRGLNYQEIDLTHTNDGSTLTIQQNFPPIFFFKTVNFLVLEVSAFLLATLLFQIGRQTLEHFPKRENPMDGKVKIFPKYFPFLSLTALTIVNYGLKIQPILFNDDWCLIASLNAKILNAFMLDIRRPLYMFLYWFVNQFLPIGQTIYALYVIQIIFLASTAILTYLLVCQILEDQMWFAFLVAVLWLIFPSDYTRLYLSMLGPSFGYLLMIISMILSVRLIKKGNLILGLLAGILLFFSLLMYEGHLGLALIWPILLGILYRRQITRTKIIGMVEYYLGIGFFVLWRLVIQPSFYYHDIKLDYLRIDAGVILERYFGAFRTILGGFRFPDVINRLLTPVNLIILLGLLMGWVWIYVISRRLSQTEGVLTDVDKILRNNIGILAFGFVLWVAGYMPILLNYPPNIYGDFSRVNFFSILGAAVVLLALFQLITISLYRNKERANNLTILMVMSLVVIGSIVQIQTQESYNQSWLETKAFYQTLLEKVPDIRPETQVVFNLSGYENLDPSNRPLFTSSWEADCALRTLYDQPALTVRYRYDQLYVPPFPGMNILAGALNTDSIQKIENPEQLLVLDYDYATRQINIQKNVSSILGKEGSTKYNPEDRILSSKKPVPSRDIIKQ